jgi:hypothetical protein
MMKQQQQQQLERRRQRRRRTPRNAPGGKEGERARRKRGKLR